MNALLDIAFGAEPGRWPLPAARTPEQTWQRAVAAGGQGRYASALADLDAVLRTRPDGPLPSLAFSTTASFLRQLGGHLVARRWDGRAWAHAGDDEAAGADALIGLAADALGVGRFPAAHQLLHRAAVLLGGHGEGRLPIRLAWVRAELAMVTADGAAAVRHAESAVELATPFGSARHAVKSQVVLAAARCSAGDVDIARGVADEALSTAERLGLLPLSWALTCVLADIGSAVHAPERIIARRDGHAAEVRRRGGTWTAR